MKLKFKNIFLPLLLIFLSLIPFFRANAFKSPYDTTDLAIESSANEKSENADDSDVFSFIKDNKNVKDFFYDGSALLYGGILLIIISVFGIFKTLKPKKKKKRRSAQERNHNRTMNNRR